MSQQWISRFVLVTPSALGWPEGNAIVERTAAFGAEVVRLSSDRLTGLPDSYRDAKRTLAVITTSPSGAGCSRSHRLPTGVSTWRRAARRIVRIVIRLDRLPGRRSSAHMQIYLRS
jgi:hypothetical protein